MADAITLVHLPEGPTAYFKLTSIELTTQIFVRHTSLRSFHFVDPLSSHRATRERRRITRSLFLMALSHGSDTPSGGCSRHSSHLCLSSKGGRS